MFNELVEYINLHKISLEQDWENAQNNLPIDDDEYYESDSYYKGCIDSLEHILNFANNLTIANNN